MLLQPTMDNLKSLKLFGMAQALESQLQLPDSQSLSFEDRLGLIVDTELTYRYNRRLQSRLKTARFAQAAQLEDVVLQAHRGIKNGVINALATCAWILKHQNVIVLGATGVGKTYLACALAHKACREGYTATYYRASRLFEELAIAKADGRYPRLLAAIAKKDVLVIDDFGMSPLNLEERRYLLEVVEDRYDRRSTIITSQLPFDHWHDTIGDPTIADATLDRVVHNAHKLHLKGESRRKDKDIDMQLIN